MFDNLLILDYIENIKNENKKRMEKIECMRLGKPHKEKHPGMDLLADIGRRKIDVAKQTDPNYKKKPLGEILES